MTPAALGLRAHSGWAAVVAVGGWPEAPVAIERTRIELTAPGSPKQPYHAAEGLELNAAGKLVKRCVDEARSLGRRGLSALAAELREKGYQVAGCGLLLASGRPLPSLAATLASHALIHAAEGELFREALIHASEECNLPVTGVKERELFAKCEAALRVPAGELQRRLTEMGRSIGPPWRQDEKLAALAGWLALAGTRGRPASRSAG